MLILSQADVDRLLPMAACIDVMAATLASLARGEGLFYLVGEAKKLFESNLAPVRPV